MENSLIWILSLCLILTGSCTCADDACKKEPRCRISRTHGMKAADCFDRNFRTFPKCIQDDVEVIELSLNRIRKISKSDLGRFKYLKFLYLTDNLIFNLDEEAFTDMSRLHTLDLSINAITKLPAVIFQLPSLINLRLSQNMNINIIDAIEVARPISSPLTQLDISMTTDEDNITEFPDLGIVPLLLTLNISHNLYYSISAKKFAGMCNLQNLYNINMTVGFDDPCQCWILNNWLKERNVKFTSFVCSVDRAKCLEVDVSEEEMEIYNNCNDTYQDIESKNRLWKIFLGIGIALLVAITIVFLYFCVIKKQCRHKKVDKLIYPETVSLQADKLTFLNNQQKTLKM